MSVTVLKFGWEFPPHHYGGLGVACQGLVHGLIQLGTRIILVLPYRYAGDVDSCVFPYNDQLLKVERLPVVLKPYVSSLYENSSSVSVTTALYSDAIFAEVFSYAQLARSIATNYTFDVIHAHDWLSICAGLEAKKISGKPLIIHIHATELDRTGGNGVHPTVFSIEQEGMQAADAVITVSHQTKKVLVERYGIPAEKITVIYHGVPLHVETFRRQELSHVPKNMVVFVGRVTLQKGPDYFVAVAKKVLQYRDDVHFVIVGSGDMQALLMRKVAQEGLAERIFFTGFLAGHEALHVLSMAKVFIMPSVCEPFGLAALEAMKLEVPVIISRTAGVCEVTTHCLKSDFWDINAMADHVLALLSYPSLTKTLKHNAYQALRGLSWQEAARQCLAVYQGLM